MSEPHSALGGFRNPIFWLALFIGAAVVIVAVAVSGFSEFGPLKLFTHYELLMAEGRGVEFAEMVLYLIVFVCSMALAAAWSGRRRLYIPFGLYFFILAMEESDWLQQVFRYPSPDFFVRYNKFKAVNIHNLLIFTENRSLPAGQAFSLGFLLLPMGLFLLYHFWKAYKGNGLSRMVAAMFAFAVVAECIPLQPVFQLLLGIFALAYVFIVASVELERRKASIESPQPAQDSVKP